MPAKAKATVTTDHEEIRRWAEERGAKPACVRNTGGKDDLGILRLDFPGYSGAQSLEAVEWDEWFEKFDEMGLALLHQESTARGQKSNFNKLISRETATEREAGNSHASKHKGTSKSAVTAHSTAARSTAGKGSSARSESEVSSGRATHGPAVIRGGKAASSAAAKDGRSAKGEGKASRSSAKHTPRKAA